LVYIPPKPIVDLANQGKIDLNKLLCLTSSNASLLFGAFSG